MKKAITTLIMLLVAVLSYAQTAADNPKADPKACVVAGNARFTVLTDRLIRMEWSEDGVFEDRASLAIVNRNLPVPEFKVTRSGKKTTIKTSALTLSYTSDGKPFSEKNLSVVFSMNPSDRKAKNVTWTPASEPTGNLLGTTRTLDGGEGYKKINKGDPWEEGILSRDGWALVDESTRHLFVSDDSDWKNWVESRPEGKRQDLYIFAYGHDYLAALSDFTKVAGKIPMPPKYMFGYWWSRYWQYSDFEFVNLGRQMRERNIPIDIMVIDMDWHDTFSLKRRGAPKDEYDQRIGWTGYTWQKELFPDPENFLTDIHEMNLKTSLNLHPASGIQPYEECYERFKADYLSRTSDYDGPKDYIRTQDDKWGKAGSGAPVPFRIDQKEWADAYFNSVIHPLERQGVDFWWLDWQQWKESKYTKDLSNTFWLNYTFFNDKVRQSVSQGIHAPRPVIYHRWGGLGSHRYQIGFSGDTHCTWEVLQFLPDFTATASNVGYCYWGHDIGGHMFTDQKAVDPDMYTRWLQYGVFTPIFKTHSTKDRRIERAFWEFPSHYNYMVEAIRLRYALSGYIYDAARQAYDSGVGLCRPLYYYYPEVENSYTWKEEFLFGDKILATAVCRPADGETGLFEHKMWFPEGDDWYDMSTGITYKGGSTANLLYTIAENPWFVKAGSIIPLAEEGIQSLQQESHALRLLVIPGLGESEYTHYEDDGSTQAYDSEYATTHFSKVATSESVTVTVDPRKGSYHGMNPLRKIDVVLEGSYAPTSVKVNGVSYEYARHPKDGNWSYDGYTLTVTIYIPETSAAETLTVECTFDPANDITLLQGKKGLIGRMMDVTPEFKLVYAEAVDPYPQLPSEFQKMAQAGSLLTAKPFAAESQLRAFDPQAMIDQVGSFETIPASFKTRLSALTTFQR